MRACEFSLPAVLRSNGEQQPQTARTRLLHDDKGVNESVVRQRSTQASSAVRRLSTMLRSVVRSNGLNTLLRVRLNYAA